MEADSNESYELMVVTNARLKFYRRVKAVSRLVDDSPRAPARLVRALVFLWQRRHFPALAPHRAPWGASKYLAEPEVHAFADWLGNQSFSDAAYWLATSYALWVGNEIRAKRALFFTPPHLAGSVIDTLVNHGASLTEHHWHDPACGGAAFLVPIAQRMVIELNNTNLSARKKLDRIEKNLSGNDLDPLLLDVSRAFLEMALYPLIEACGYRRLLCSSAHC